MLIGMLSDNRDNIYMIDEAVSRLNEEGAELVLHAGDYISPFTAARFRPLRAGLISVFGNSCAERDHLKKAYAEVGAEIRGFFAELCADGLKMALLHGHEEELLRSLVSSGAYDVVVHGHTYEAKAERSGGTLVINPGEVCGYLTGKCTIALVDTVTREARIAHIK